jgi:hypothetical protein
MAEIPCPALAHGLGRGFRVDGMAGNSQGEGGGKRGFQGRHGLASKVAPAQE